VAAPRGVELDEPWVLGSGYKFLEALGSKGNRHTLRIGGRGRRLGLGLGVDLVLGRSPIRCFLGNQLILLLARLDTRLGVFVLSNRGIRLRSGVDTWCANFGQLDTLRGPRPRLDRLELLLDAFAQIRNRLYTDMRILLNAIFVECKRRVRRDSELLAKITMGQTVEGCEMEIVVGGKSVGRLRVWRL